MKLRDWANYIHDNRIGPLLRELGDALEECENEQTILMATRCAVNMGNSAKTMLYYRNNPETAQKSSGEPDADNGE